MTSKKSPFKFHVSGLPLRCCRSASAPFHVAFLCALCSLLPLSEANGAWLVDGQSVQSLEVQSSSADPDAVYADGSRPILSTLSFAEEVTLSGDGLFNVWAPWEDEYELFGFNDFAETFVLCPSRPSLGLEAAGFIMDGRGKIQMLGESANINFEERTFGGGGWYASSVANDATAVLNQGYADSRYHQKTAITTPLKFAPEVSSYSTGLFKATVPGDDEYELFVFNDPRMSVALCPDFPSLGFEAGNLALYDEGIIKYLGGASSISFEERALAGGGWSVATVADDNLAILNRSYADGRYIQRTEGITTNHTFQAGDVLQIQNGIITAINP